MPCVYGLSIHCTAVAQLGLRGRFSTLHSLLDGMLVHQRNLLPNIVRLFQQLARRKAV